MIGSSYGQIILIGSSRGLVGSSLLKEPHLGPFGGLVRSSESLIGPSGGVVESSESMRVPSALEGW